MSFQKFVLMTRKKATNLFIVRLAVSQSHVESQQLYIELIIVHRKHEIWVKTGLNLVEKNIFRCLGHVHNCCINSISMLTTAHNEVIQMLLKQ